MMKKNNVIDLFSKGQELSEDMAVRIELILEVSENMSAIPRSRYNEFDSLEQQKQFSSLLNDLCYLLGIRVEYNFSSDWLASRLESVDNSAIEDFCDYLPHYRANYTDYYLLPNGQVINYIIGKEKGLLQIASSIEVVAWSILENRRIENGEKSSIDKLFELVQSLK